MATITREFAPGSRYLYDFGLKPADGWAQLDTRQDAPYYGTWVNPVTLTLFNYCEGDTTHTQCTDDADFIAEVTACVRWNRDNGHFIGIDGMCNDTIIATFTRLGLAEFLH